MEFPFGHGHHSHSHHHRREDDEEEQERHDHPPPAFSSFDNPPPPPPPSFLSGDEPPPPPPSFSDFPAPPPPPRPQNDSFSYDDPSEDAPPPPAASVYRVSHDNESERHHSHRLHVPSFFQHHDKSDEMSSELANKPSVKVVTKAEPNYSLTVAEGKVILAKHDPSDEFQHWYKDEKYSTRVKDEEGFPCFALVNKATGQALKHSIGAGHPVQLIPYKADILDESILWTESKDFGSGFRTIRMVNNIRLNVDAFHGDKKSGGVHDGTTIVLSNWNKVDNQLWKILPYCMLLSLSSSDLHTLQHFHLFFLTMICLNAGI